MKDSRTLERLIKKSTVPYGTLLERAEKGGMVVEKLGDGVVKVRDSFGKAMTLFFENDSIFNENKDNGLIVGHYHYSK